MDKIAEYLAEKDSQPRARLRGKQKKEACYLELGDFIKTLREERGLSQFDLGKLTGMNRTSWTHIESGTVRIMYHTLLDVLDLFLYEIKFVKKREK